MNKEYCAEVGLRKLKLHGKACQLQTQDWNKTLAASAPIRCPGLNYIYKYRFSSYTQCYCFFIYPLDFVFLPHPCLCGVSCLLPAPHMCLSSFLWFPPSRQHAMSLHSHHVALVLFLVQCKGGGSYVLAVVFLHRNFLSWCEIAMDSC